MAWDEWEQLKSRSAQRTRTDHVAAPGGGGPGPDLKASQGPWTKASGVAEELRTAADSALTELKAAHEGVEGSAEGFASTTALSEILPTWEKRLTSVRDECGRLHGALARTGRDLGEIDPAVAGKVDGVRVPDQAKPEWAR